MDFDRKSFWFNKRVENRISLWLCESELWQSWWRNTQFLILVLSLDIFYEDFDLENSLIEILKWLRLESVKVEYI